MASSSAALADDDVLSAFSKPKDGSNSAGAPSADDQILQAFSKSVTPPAAPTDPNIGLSTQPEYVPWLDQTKPSQGMVNFLDPLRQQLANPTEEPPGYKYGNIVPFGSGPNGQFGPAVPNVLMDAFRSFNRQVTNPNPDTQAADALNVAQLLVGGSVVKGRGAAGLAPEAAPNRLIAAPTEAPLPDLAAAPAAANALAPAAAENRLMTPSEAPPSVVTPTEGPKARLLPVRTPDQADAEADRILQHFAGNGSTTIAPQSIIPGSTQTLSRAIQGGNPGISGLESRIAEQFPNDFVALDKANQAARSAHFDALAGSPADVAAASGERDAAFASADKAVFDPANIKPTDPTPVIAQIDQVLAGREGQRSAVASALQDVRSKLVDAKGNLQTDPDLLYGIRKSINDDIAPAAKGTANDKTQAARELIQVRNALDPVIEAGAPGFTKFIGDYSAASAPIDGMKYLQSMKLTDTQGNITLQKLDTAIKSLERIQALPGARAGDGVSPEQLSGLNALRDDMRLDAQRQLGKAVGSNTVQNLGTNRVLSTLGHPLVGATGLGGSIANPWIGIPAMAARFALQKAGDKGQEMVFEALRRKLLNPQDAASAFPPKQ